MTVDADGGLAPRQIAVRAAPFVVVALAGIAIRTPLAAAWPLAALLLFLWMVADAMMLALVARSTGRPPARAMLGAMAGASAVVWLGLPAGFRATLWGMPAIVAGMAMLVAGHLARGAVRARRVLSAPPGGERWIAAASEILPPALVRVAAAELAVVHMALFRWGGPADVPADARAFAYHRHLAPMCAALLILSAIEIAVYHLLVGHWSRTAAIVMFVLGDVGLVYLVGVIKSFRCRPVLLVPGGVRIRAGVLIDQAVPLDAIAAVETGFSGEAVRDPATLNAALLAWPNILLRLAAPLPRRSRLGRRRTVTAVAFRLDDPEPFVRLLRWRLGQRADG